jgi:hypothetical protein
LQGPRQQGLFDDAKMQRRRVKKLFWPFCQAKSQYLAEDCEDRLREHCSYSGLACFHG